MLSTVLCGPPAAAEILLSFAIWLVVAVLGENCILQKKKILSYNLVLLSCCCLADFNRSDGTRTGDIPKETQGTTGMGAVV